MLEMMSKPVYRKRCKRYDDDRDAHCLTFSCYRRLKFFARERVCNWMVEALQHGRQQNLYDLWAYVVMPEHVHIVIWPHPEIPVSTILKAVKQSVSKRALLWLTRNGSQFLRRIEHVKANGDREFRFWQRGGGYDRNLRSVDDIHEKIEYIHNNPVRRGLVEKAVMWNWSSCAAWETGVDSPIAIDRASLPPQVVVVRK